MLGCKSCYRQLPNRKAVASVARAKQPLHSVDLSLAPHSDLDVAFLCGACCTPATVQCCFGPAQSLLAHCTAGRWRAAQRLALEQGAHNHGTAVSHVVDLATHLDTACWCCSAVFPCQEHVHLFSNGSGCLHRHAHTGTKHAWHDVRQHARRLCSNARAAQAAGPAPSAHSSKRRATVLLECEPH